MDNDKVQINRVDENNSPILFTLYTPNLLYPATGTGSTSVHPQLSTSSSPPSALHHNQSFPCLSPIPASGSYRFSSSSDSSSSASSSSQSSSGSSSCSDASSSSSSPSEEASVVTNSNQQQDTSNTVEDDDDNDENNEIDENSEPRRNSEAEDSGDKDKSGKHEEKKDKEESKYFENFTRSIFIRVVTKYLEITTDLNSTKVPKRENPVSIFFSIKKPSMCMYDYIHRLITYTHCSPSVFVLALIYLKRLATYEMTLRPCIMNIHRLLTVSITVAVKLLDDRCFSINHYAKVGGVPSKREMVRMEVAFLKLIHYDTFVHVYCYQVMLEKLQHIHGELECSKITTTTTVENANTEMDKRREVTDNGEDEYSREQATGAEHPNSDENVSCGAGSSVAGESKLEGISNKGSIQQGSENKEIATLASISVESQSHLTNVCPSSLLTLTPTHTHTRDASVSNIMMNNAPDHVQSADGTLKKRNRRQHQQEDSSDDIKDKKLKRG